MNKGFVIMACDTEKVSYHKCAVQLEKSLKRCMPDANVTIITTDKLPHGDFAKSSEWKLINDWQVYDASPYDYTIKLEADIVIPRTIEYWWDILKDRDVIVSTHIRNYKQELSDIRFYRKFIDDNKLPDCYNGITYFKKSELAKTFFLIVRTIFENWNDFTKILRCDSSEMPTTDFIYAIACHILGVEKTTLPLFKDMSMVHMKGMINGLIDEDWTKILNYEILYDSFRIGTVPQKYPVHYHIKSFVNELEKKYG